MTQPPQSQPLDVVDLSNVPPETARALLRDAWRTLEESRSSAGGPVQYESQTVTRVDQAWRDAAQAYLAAKRLAALAELQAALAKSKLLTLARTPREQGAGVGVTRYTRPGATARLQIVGNGLNLTLYQATVWEEIQIAMTEAENDEQT